MSEGSNRCKTILCPYHTNLIVRTATRLKVWTRLNSSTLIAILNLTLGLTSRRILKARLAFLINFFAV